MNKGFALYRQPYERHCTLLRGGVEELADCRELNGREGFVMAPFAVAEGQPVVLISPDELRTCAVSDLDKGWLPEEAMSCCENLVPMADDDDYPFVEFHERLMAGDFAKIVLARTRIVKTRVSPLDCFRRACDLYPRLFIVLVGTPESGLWLMATPEILLEGRGRTWSTMALAGTMRLTVEQAAMTVPYVQWSEKNIEEQRLVARYIDACLRQFADHVEEQGPYTSRAAHLVHLRSDFTFCLADAGRLGDLLTMLHPTPAVCGLPKQAAFDFIVAHEPVSRRYYSGFAGVLSPSADTHLYVSLRCMQLFRDGCRLYAGGGLLKDSIQQKEWAETEAKMETITNILGDVQQ